jgi:type IV pilus assembly protein PilB
LLVLLSQQPQIVQSHWDLRLDKQKGSGRRLGEVLFDEGIITEADLIEALQMQLGIEFVDLSQVDIDPEMSRLVSRNVARQYNVVPIKATPDEIYLAMSDPLNFLATEAVKTATRKRVVPVLATSDAIRRAIMTLYGNEGAARAIEEMKREAKSSEDVSTYSAANLDEEGDSQSAPTIRLVNSIIERAATERASDIHLEPRMCVCASTAFCEPSSRFLKSCSKALSRASRLSAT